MSVPASPAFLSGGETQVPTLAQWRALLRTAPHDADEPVGPFAVAHRLRGLTRRGCIAQARALATRCIEPTPADPADPSADPADPSADPADPPAAREALLLAALEAHAAAIAEDPVGAAEDWERTAAALVALQARAGRPGLARATAQVLRETAPAQAASPCRVAVRAGEGPSRRHAAPVEICPDLLAYARGRLSAPSGASARPLDGVRRLRAALDALDALDARGAAHDQLLGEPRAALTARLAEALAADGRTQEATTAALDVLDVVAERAAREGDPDPEQAALSAHALLVGLLGEDAGLGADIPVGHGAEALRLLGPAGDPLVRAEILRDLLPALMRADLPDHAHHAAGRLMALQHRLPRDSDRIHALLAVAAHRTTARRWAAAHEPLRHALRIAAGQRDRRGTLDAYRALARLHQSTGQTAEMLASLRRVASEARWIADDLATGPAERRQRITQELGALALIQRCALDLGRLQEAERAAAAIERRTRPEGGRPVLPAHLLWDHRVDARAGRMIAAGLALADGTDGASPEAYRSRRREVLELIDQVPTGHEDRARFWAAYVEDRHAAMLAERGDARRARRAAEHARDAWRQLGDDEGVARMQALLARLTPPTPGARR